MKFWTYKEASDKVIQDLDLQDELFVSPNEMIGYFNEGIEEAEGEILKLSEDYLLTSAPLPLVAGQSNYSYPPNMYAYKIRGIEYQNGAIIYPITRFREKDKFNNIAFGNQYSEADDYRYYTTNNSPGNSQIVLVPASRETATVPPNINPFTPATIWYIRQAQRVPLSGEYIPYYEQFIPSAVDTLTDAITISGAYVTGDRVQLTVTNSGQTSGVMPSGLAAGTTYFVIAASSTTIKLATTLANAKNNVPIDITSIGAGIFTIALAATNNLINNLVIDIPEFTTFVMQWAKCRCLEKEGDPRLEGASSALEHLRKQMVDNLTQKDPDDQDTITPDLSAYYDMS